MRDSESQARRTRAARRGLLGFGAALLISTASAQYAFDGPTDDHDMEGVRYFGSAKDEKGLLLADVTFLLESKQGSFVFITDADGRFRGTLPLAFPANTITAKCWGAGLESVKVTKRPGPKAARPTVQVDCVLRKPIAT